MRKSPSESSTARSANSNQRSSAASGARRSKSDSYALKFLIESKFAGNFIGAGGSMHKEFQEVTGIIAHISRSDQVFPGTTERIIYLNGDGDGVTLAVSLLWKLLAGAESGKTWKPRSAERESDSARVSGNISIPMDAAGGVIGKGGSFLRTIEDESGAKVVVNPKDSDSEKTRERTVSISGTVKSCTSAVLKIIDKMSLDEENAKYTFPGTSYGAAPREDKDDRGGKSEKSERDQSRGRAAASGGRASSSRDDSEDKKYASTIVKTSSTIQMAVENDKIGNIIGKQGSTLRELMSSTETTIIISPKGEYMKGTTKRLVTITGPAKSARSAHIKINKLVNDE